MSARVVFGSCLLSAAMGCADPLSGRIDALTYNVAGLPEGLSKSHPERNTPQMSPLFNELDLVLVQEDFTYHDELISQVDHPYRSVPKEPTDRLVADGLNRLSRSPFSNHERQPWSECSGGFADGSDCLAEKGYEVAMHLLAEGIEVDIYNLHLDAGGDDPDAMARRAQVTQLLEAMAARSSERAIIVAGDTNLRLHRAMDVETLEMLKREAGLTEACEALDCPEPDHIDRFLYRSSARVELAAEAWSVDGRFVDEAGDPLSDHPAVRVLIGWTEGSN